MYPDYYPKGKLDANTVGSINGRIKDLFIAKFGGIVLNSADTIVISAFLGLTLLAVYQNYYFVMSSVCGIMEILLTSIYDEKFTSASLICKVFYGKMKAQWGKYTILLNLL